MTAPVEIDAAIRAWRAAGNALSAEEEASQRADYAAGRYRVRQWAKRWAGEVMTGREIARRAGLTPQRVSQLIARGETAGTILSGAYLRPSPPPPGSAAARCTGCERTDGHIGRYGHAKRCPQRPGATAATIGRSRCGSCGVIGHNRRTCPMVGADCRGSSRGSGDAGHRIHKRANGFEPSTFSLGSQPSTESDPAIVRKRGEPGAEVSVKGDRK